MTGGAISRGFLNEYDGSGYTQIVKLNMSDENYFRDFFMTEILHQNLTQLNSTLSIIVQFVVYNPNLKLL